MNRRKFITAALLSPLVVLVRPEKKLVIREIQAADFLAQPIFIAGENIPAGAMVRRDPDDNDDERLYLMRCKDWTLRHYGPGEMI